MNDAQAIRDFAATWMVGPAGITVRTACERHSVERASNGWEAFVPDYAAFPDMSPANELECADCEAGR